LLKITVDNADKYSRIAQSMGRKVSRLHPPIL
jgi:hypothetical protein